MMRSIYLRFTYRLTYLLTVGAKKSNPLEKFYISEIVADIFTKFAEITDEHSINISRKFY